jgi:hypothetical protein
MANEIRFAASALGSYKAYIFRAGLVWNGATFAAVTAAAKAAGAVTLVQQDVTLDYFGSIPGGINTAGDLEIQVVAQAGVATGDEPAIASGVIVWSGTAEIPMAAIAGYIDSEVAAIKTVTDQLVAAQAEPVAVPAANATPLQKLAWLFTLARNKITQSATTQTLRNDGDTASIGSTTVSDDGTTFTRGKFI